MHAPRPVFVLALSATVFAGLAALAVPRVAQALPVAQAAVPAAREALQQRAPGAARALGLAEERAEVPRAAPPPEAAAPAGVEAAGFATQELGGFTVPDFAAMAGQERLPAVALPRWTRRGG